MVSTKSKLIALIMAAVLFATALTAAGIADIPRMGMPMADGTDWVALYYAENGEGSGTTTSSMSSASSAYPHANIQKAIKDYAAVNSDVIGWLKVPNTNMDFPITYNNQHNNEYYLYRDWRGTNYPSITWQNWYNYPDTATFLDYRTRLGTGWSSSSYNMVLYGHNWNNLRAPFGIGNYDNLHMFGQLPSYTNLDFATKNAHIYFSTGDTEGIWRVFAVGYCTTSPYFFYNNPNPSKEQRQFLIDEWRNYSQFDFNVDVTSDDRLLTLTTCTRQYGSGDTQRFVVVARLLREGESETDVVTATVNPDFKQPDFSLPVKL